eukprot:m.101228 g.101228  ORF g.101228 m.101228 type:complete len:1595 (+) comp13736_c2_seq2:1510-6294(+)
MAHRMIKKLCKDQKADCDPDKFLQEAVKLETEDLLFLLDSDPGCGRQRVRDCMRKASDLNFMTNRILPFIDKLTDLSVSNGCSEIPQMEMLLWIWKTPGFSKTIAAYLEKKRIPKQNLEEIARLVLILSKNEEMGDDVRNGRHSRSIVNCLQDQNPSNQIVKKISAVFSGNNNHGRARAAAQEIEKKHSNDKDDFRDIQILPTVDELESLHHPRVLHPNPTNPTSHNEVLDAHFRLLREDFLGPILRPNQRDHSKRGYKDEALTLNGVKAVKAVIPQKFQFHIPAHFEYSFNLPDYLVERLKKKSKKETEEFWKKSRMLSNGSLVILEKEKETVLAIVAHRSVENLSAKPPVIGLRFISHDAGDDNASIGLKHLQASNSTMKMYNFGGNFFSYRPILEKLQKMDHIPLAEKLYPSIPQQPYRYQEQPYQCQEQYHQYQPGMLFDNDYKNTDEYRDLDTVQKKALIHAHKSQVSLVQGPPGTGKTRVGKAIAKLLLTGTEKTILCLCYTNHALDSFLADLVGDLDEAYKQQVVRIGGRCSLEELESLRLETRNKLEEKNWTPAQRSRFYELKDALEGNSRSANINQGTGKAPEPLRKRFEKDLKKCSYSIGEKWWDKVSAFLASNDAKSLQQLAVPTDSSSFQRVHKGGKTIQENYLWSQWLKGKDPSPFNDLKSKPLWKMNATQRHAKKEEWQTQMFEDDRERTGITMERIEKKRSELRQLEDQSRTKLIQKSRLIACTTWGAANYSTLLRENSADVIIIEEAAEVLEAHVITALTDNVENLILIGDHKQLRPKIEHFTLTKESNKGYNLNRSLFERLVEQKKVPLTTLRVQHRMRPEMSAIIKHMTYPDLQDAPHTRRKPKTRGLQTNIVFVNHNNPEVTQNKQSAKNMEESHMKINKWEAEMVVATAGHLLKQGYKAEDIVLLTPYLGQLVEIKTKLEAAKFSARFGELDVGELARQKIQTEKDNSRNNKTPQRIRVATVDNFQAEEATIIILSLVRSNVKGVIGFLKHPERVNVAFSRAKEGLVVFGDISTFCKHSALWRKLCEKLVSDKVLFNGVPIECEVHGTRHTCKSSEDFRTISPNGGCEQVCNKILHKCRHKCQLPCHPGKDCETFPCQTQVSKYCRVGHTWRIFCSKKENSPCPHCQKKERLEKEHAQKLKTLEEEKKKIKLENEDILKLQKMTEKEIAEEDKVLKEKEKQMKEKGKLRKLKLQGDLKKAELETKHDEHAKKIEEQIKDYEGQTKKKIEILRKEMMDKRKAREKELLLKKKDLEAKQKKFADDYDKKIKQMQKDFNAKLDKIKQDHEKERKAIQSSKEVEALEANIIGEQVVSKEKQRSASQLKKERNAPTPKASVFPKYWKTTDKKMNKIDVTKEMKDKMQQVIDGTVNRAALGNGKDQIQRATYSRLQVVKVERIENRNLFLRYSTRKLWLKDEAAKIKTTLAIQPTNLRVKSYERWMRDTLESQLNEVYLFHGTKPDVAAVIVETGFEEKVASLSGMYGAGIYFADQANKSDQYTTADRNGHHHMFLSRVTMGGYPGVNSTGNGKRITPLINNSKIHRYTSTHGTNGMHHEYIVFEKDQAYPEYLITYKRK